MYELKDFELEGKMNDAYHYLTLNLSETGHNSKPVLMHSIAVSMTLYHLGYNEEIVISSILHDVIEDTDVCYEDVKSKFGENIADIVNAVSFNPDIEDKILQTKEVYKRIGNQGYQALIVKCSDLFCNLPFIECVKKEETLRYLKTKYKLFIEMFGEELSKEKIYNLFVERYKSLIND